MEALKEPTDVPLKDAPDAPELTFIVTGIPQRVFVAMPANAHRATHIPQLNDDRACALQWRGDPLPAVGKILLGLRPPRHPVAGFLCKEWGTRDRQSDAVGIGQLLGAARGFVFRRAAWKLSLGEGSIFRSKRRWNTALFLTGLAAVLLQVCGPTAGAQEPPASNAESSGTTRPLKSPGDHLHFLEFDGLRRSCLIHIPPKLDFSKPVPLVLVLHGAAMNAAMMAGFSGMNQEADVSGFVAVYPNGTGLQELLLVWNSGGVGPVRQRPDDVGFIRALLDDLIPELNIDPRRVFATGMSNGGMMSYRLAAELSDKIAAIAPVGGTLAIPDPQPQRPVPLIHFHGTDDGIVPWAGPRHRAAQRHEFQSVPDTIATWLRLTGAQQKPVTEEIPDRFDDGTSVRVHTHPAGKSGAEVVLVEITGGGHTWPGRQPAFAFIGRSTREISANRMIWDFFKKHPMPADP